MIWKKLPRADPNKKVGLNEHLSIRQYLQKNILTLLLKLDMTNLRWKTLKAMEMGLVFWREMELVCCIVIWIWFLPFSRGMPHSSRVGFDPIASYTPNTHFPFPFLPPSNHPTYPDPWFYVRTRYGKQHLPQYDSAMLKYSWKNIYCRYWQSAFSS